MTADLSFADGRTAHLECDMLSPRLFRSRLRMEGSDGHLQVFNPFHPHWFHRLTVRGRSGKISEQGRGDNSYTLQLRAFVKAIRGEIKLNTDPNDAVGNMRVIDAIYEKAGLKLRGS